jgi:hypothetical protein
MRAAIRRRWPRYAGRDELLAAIERSIDGTRDYVQAAAHVRQLMFVDRFASEVGHADEAQHAEARVGAPGH